jgi:hypothetical protein
MAVKIMLIEGKERWAEWPGPARVDAATKAGLLDLLEQACQQGWTVRAACQVVQVNEVCVYRWLGRRATDQLADEPPGGSPMHGLLDEETAEIIELFYRWGEVDRSHRKLAHRGSYLERVWVLPSSVRACSPSRACGCGPYPGLGAVCASRSRTGWRTGQGRSGSR